jgi:tRNA G18 (ribose-2'-O)-methylase SpoU
MSEAPDLSDFTKEEICEELNKIRHPIEIALHGVDNYFNAGCIIRTCHSFLVKKIHLIECDKFYKKASMCTHKYENIEKWPDLYWWHGLHAWRNIIPIEKGEEESHNLRTFEWPENPIFLFGSEKYGLPAWVTQRDKPVTIEQYGLTNSLNVSVCVGIVLQDWMTKNHGRIYGKK